MYKQTRTAMHGAQQSATTSRRWLAVHGRNAAVSSVLCIAAVVGVFLSCFGSDAQAATKAKAPTFDDRALLVNQTARYLVIPPGKAVTVWFEFRNTGTSAWTNQDPHPVSIDVDNRLNKRKSVFAVPQWRAPWRPARLQQKTVKPGETGRFRFVLKAPKKASGIYRESFALVRDTSTRIPGGNVEFVIVVGQAPDVNVLYHAKPVTPTLSFWVRPGERIYQPVYYKNNGRASWRNEGWGVTTFVHVATQNVLSASSVDANGVSVANAIQSYTKRDEKGTVFLDYTAPTTPGTYEETYALYGPYGIIDGSSITTLVTVSNEPKPPFDAEPTLRVAIYAPVKPVVVTSNGAFEARDAATGAVIGSLAAGEQVTTTYDSTNKVYSVALPTGTVASPNAVRLVPALPDSIMEIKSYSNLRIPPGSSTTVNDNKFRGILEINYSAYSKKLWVIGELPIEQYLKGLGETGSKSPVEFAKALITAARTYAMKRVLSVRSEIYHIDSTAGDQIYRGYNYELATPNITQAVTETRGMVITHPSMISENNSIGVILAAYSSCTDGRTRSYYERWGGTEGQYPFLVSVPDPLGICTNPTWLAGGGGNHMVGMSANGALQTIIQQGLPYDAVLKYYYTGVSITRAYL